MREQTAEQRPPVTLCPSSVVVTRNNSRQGPSLLVTTPEGIILESVLEGLAEYYSADLRQKVIRGMKETAKKGQYCGQSLPIGYKVDAERHIVVDEREAAVVREAFKLHIAGGQIRDIVQLFADRGIMGRRGKPVSNAVVYRMLRNEKYLGEFYIQDVKLNVEPIIATFLEAARHFKTSRNNAAGRAKVNYLLKCSASIAAR